jgi:hypothetical protein
MSCVTITVIKSMYRDKVFVLLFQTLVSKEQQEKVTMHGLSRAHSSAPKVLGLVDIH